MDEDRFRWRSLCRCGGVIHETPEPPGLSGPANAAGYVSFGGTFRAEPAHRSEHGELPECGCPQTLWVRQAFESTDEVVERLRHLNGDTGTNLLLRRAVLSYMPARPPAWNNGRFRLRALSDLSQRTSFEVAALRTDIRAAVNSITKNQEKAG